ncbi:sec1 family domain-containing protein 2-like [Copidosoma floridanum]|uniref:sec1 family domain-containing protein 2-like n=1 Tax=Copidosoma floridanum TaxID=29053 RepID=UPI0006C9B2F4|nr:sec1 family domain-containing protein 2-like [Copidosoma floridanum]
MFGDIQDFAGVCWKEVLSLVNNAAVYIDHAASECLHWYTGDRAYLTLKDAGACSIHELSLYNFHNLKAKGAKKAVIISTSTDSLFYQRTLKLIIEKNDFEKCLVVFTAHEKVLQYTSMIPDDLMRESSYDILKGDIIHWMNDKTLTENSQVTMIFKPIFIACLKKDIFVTPPFANLMPAVDKVLIDDYVLEIEFLISSLHMLFTHYNVQEDIYSLGKLANHVANKLDNFGPAINRRKRAVDQRKVSLILIDRTLDLSTATSHNSDSILGRILCTLPHLPHHYNDVAIKMHSLSLKGEECSSSFMVPGCLANRNEELMDLLINKKQKDVLLSLNKMLIDMSSSKDSPKTSKISTRVTAHSLEKGVKKFRDSESIDSLRKNSKNLQLIAAVVQALKSNKTAQIEFVISLEKLILQNLAVSGDSSSILTQLSNIVKTRASRGLEMENLLVLLIHLYAMAGPDIKFSEQQEKALKEALACAIYEDIKKCNESDLDVELSAYYQTLLLLGVSDEQASKEAANKITDKIITILHEILHQRESLKNYKQVISKSNPREMARHVGLLEHLVTDLLDESKPTIPDLVQQKPSLLSSGFNYLTKGKLSDHPCDNPWTIIYVLGGITPDEIKTVEDIINKKGAHCTRITMGGTRLLNPLDILDKILFTNINTL